jgi:hypothetical protein
MAFSFRVGIGLSILPKHQTFLIFTSEFDASLVESF